MKNLKIVINCVNPLNADAIKKALLEREITDITYLDYSDKKSNPIINFVIMVFDRYFKNFDLMHYTPEGYPDWREEKILDSFSNIIERMHAQFPNAKIFLVDTTNLFYNSLLEESIDLNYKIQDGTVTKKDRELEELHRKQFHKGIQVWKKLREQFFKTDYCVKKEFRLTAYDQEDLGIEIANLIQQIAGSK